MAASFRGALKARTRNLEIAGMVLEPVIGPRIARNRSQPSRNDRAKRWPKQLQRPEQPPAYAFAAGSPSRLMGRRAGPGMIIRRRAAARMARPMRPMSEAGASAFASRKAKPRLHATRTRHRRPRAASAQAAARR